MTDRNKANKGQDEKIHTFVNDAGDEVQGTMREFRTTLRDQGYRKPEDVVEDVPATDVTDTETPA